jgi:hypothetical protein
MLTSHLFADLYVPLFVRGCIVAEVESGKRPISVREIIQRDRRQPNVRLSVASDLPSLGRGKVSVRITVVDAPAGASDLRLFRNGSLIRAWHGDVLKGKSSTKLEAAVPIVAGENRLTAYAFNRDNIKSADAVLLVQGTNNLKRIGVACVLVIGIDHYANPSFDLQYAAADARSFAAEVKRQLGKVHNYKQVKVTPVLDSEATKARILTELQRMADISEPKDAAIVYYAGHGVAQGPRYYLIPHDLGYDGERSALDHNGREAIVQHGISDMDLEQAFELLDAAHVLLVLDACYSGQVLEAEEERRGPMNSTGIAQLAYEKGMYLLAAAQSHQVALEAAKLGHGYLTYASVEEGLRGHACSGNTAGDIGCCCGAITRARHRATTTRLLPPELEDLPYVVAKRRRN